MSDQQVSGAEAADPMDERLTRTAASLAVEPIGWRYLLGNLAASVPVGSLTEAATVAAAVTAACGDHADRHLRLDLRPDRVDLCLLDRELASATRRDTELAAAIATALAGTGAVVAPPVSSEYPRPVQMLEIAIDALNIAAIRPFWKAVLGFTGEPGLDGPEDAIIDPAGQLPAVWFQQMDEPRQQRNRIHFDISVAHDEADSRIQAALDAGGVLVSDASARAFWILADSEGNEICVCTWQDRDERTPLAGE
ncbi:MAG TPA: VOC family protein [Streptosporangiaceae bacterium]|nr:VOC family protein [Streptosporangiaceae bacterium]